MSQLTKYDNIKDMKANAKPLDLASAESQERHEKFERFINSWKSCEVVSSSPSQNTAPKSKEVVYGL